MTSLTDHPWVGVDCIIVNENDEFFLIHRSSNSVSYPDHWGLVGGWMDWGETVEQALKREAQEEIGVEIEVVRFLGKYFDTPGRHQTKTSIALPHICKIISGEPSVHQIEEVQDIGWFSLPEIENMKLAYDHIEMIRLAKEVLRM